MFLHFIRIRRERGWLELFNCPNVAVMTSSRCGIFATRSRNPKPSFFPSSYISKKKNIEVSLTYLRNRENAGRRETFLGRATAAQPGGMLHLHPTRQYYFYQ